VKDNARGSIFGICIDRAARHAGWLNAVIAAHGEIAALSIRVDAAFDLSYAAEQNVCRISVLLVARNHTAFASDALGHVEVESVLFAWPWWRREQ
jgi:hypothetical protein